MAFSTQQDFLRLQIPCPHIEGLKMKTYASTLDQRAWSMSQSKQSQYLVDLLTCTLSTSGNDGNGHELNAISSPGQSRKQAAERENLSKGGHGPKASCSTESKTHQIASRDNLIPTLGDDSVLNCALKSMTKMEELLAEKKNLQTELDVSHEKLRILKEEKQTITAILQDEHCPEMASTLADKIKQLRSSSKIDKNDENELCKIVDTYYNREKAYKVLDAQNCYLRRLVEKLSARRQLATISVEPEKSTDINYLQCEVNNLRKEVKLLRNAEDEKLQKQTVSRGVQGPTQPTEKDVENVAKILAERNALREKCHHFAALEDKIMQWKRDSEQFEQFRAEACCALKRKDDELQDYLDEIDELQHKLTKYEKCSKAKAQEADTLCTSIDCLKEENRQLREELYRCDSDQKCMGKLQNQLQCLTDELCEKNCIIDQYDMQFQQLLGVIENLQTKASVDIRGLQDVDSQTHNDEIDELAAATKATLSHISKELETKQVLETDLHNSKSDLQAASAKLNESKLENERLKECIEKLNKTCVAVRQTCAVHQIDTTPGEDCTADVKRLSELIAKLKSEKQSSGERTQLQKENDDLNARLKECQNKLKAQEDQLKKLHGSKDNIASELRTSKANLKEVGKLVNDISSVQGRNESLKNVLGAVDNCAELQKELDALKKKLDDESKKNAQLTDQNKKLQSEVETAKQDANQKQAELKKLQSQIEGDGTGADLDGRPAPVPPASAAPVGSGGEGASAPAPPAPPVASVKRSSAKIAQLQKVHENQRKTDRSNYEKEIDGHRMTTEFLQKSITKIAARIPTSTALEMEREFRMVLDNFMDEICKWRCAKSCKKLNKLQEICQKIIDWGIECLTFKELAYLHQTIASAAQCSTPKGLAALERKRDLKCCKCSGELSYVPSIPKESEMILLEKLSTLERDIESARESLRRIKQDPGTTSMESTEQSELDTIRASNTYRTGRRNLYQN